MNVAINTRMKLVGPLVAWTLFVWLSRIRNVWTNDDLSQGAQVLRTVVAVVFVALGVAMAQRLWARMESELTTNDRRFLTVFVVWTIGFWLVRGVGIIVDDHTASFTAVHTVLMAISIGFALLAARVLPRAVISSSRLVDH